MYADDIVCFLENNLFSVKELQRILTQFGLILGQKGNESKSVVLGFNIKSALRQELSEIFPAKWQRENIIYLGAKICRCNAQTVLENINPVVAYFEGKCRVWESHHLSWLGRVVAFKTVLLPKLFFFL